MCHCVCHRVVSLLLLLLHHVSLSRQVKLQSKPYVCVREFSLVNLSLYACVSLFLSHRMPLLTHAKPLYYFYVGPITLCGSFSVCFV